MSAPSFLEVLVGAHPGSALGRNFRSEVDRFVEEETGLPPCAELLYFVRDDSARRVTQFVMRFPGGYEANTDFSDVELHATPATIHGHLLEGAIRRMARQWGQTFVYP